jgi:predicted ATP-grasp superfamily ATP-dependent carboligase
LSTYSNPVITIGGGTNGLGIARNLGKLNIDVFCLTSNPYELMLNSKYCKGFAFIPNIEKDKNKLLKILNHFEKNLSEKCVLFPTSDSSLLTFSSIADELNAYVTCIPNKKIIETCVLKNNFYKSLETYNVPHPTTFFLDEEKLEDILPKLTFPVYIRPSMSQSFADIFGKKGFVARTKQEVLHYIKVAKKHEIEVMIQDIIPGPTQNGYVLRGYIDKKSRLLGIMADQKIRQSTMFSNNAVKHSIPLSYMIQAKRTLITYLQNIKYQGVFHAEFKKDPRDDVLKLLEINARTSGGNYFGFACGMNHVLLAYLDAIGEAIQPVMDYESDIYVIHVLRDVPILLNKCVNGQLSYQDFYMYFKKKIGHIFLKDDFLPFLTAIQARIYEGGLLKLIAQTRNISK